MPFATSVAATPVSSLRRSISSVILTETVKAAVGGMGVRMLAMLGLMVLMLKVVGLDPLPFLISLLGFYAVFLVLEVLYLQSKVSAKNQG